jgi:hypothetical protein
VCGGKRSEEGIVKGNEIVDLHQKVPQGTFNRIVAKSRRLRSDALGRSPLGNLLLDMHDVHSFCLIKKNGRRKSAAADKAAETTPE